MDGYIIYIYIYLLDLSSSNSKPFQIILHPPLFYITCEFHTHPILSKQRSGLGLSSAEIRGGLIDLVATPSKAWSTGHRDTMATGQVLVSSFYFFEVCFVTLFNHV